MSANSFSQITYSRRPSQIRPGEVLLLNGQEARVRDITIIPAPPLAPKHWVFDALAADGAEIVAERTRDELVQVVLKAHGRAA